MKRFIFISALLISSSPLFSQKSVQVSVEGNIFNVKADSIFIASASQQGIKNIIGAPISKKGDFKIQGKVPVADYYILRVSENAALSIILRENSKIKVYGDGKDLYSFNNFIGSDESQHMNHFIAEWRKINMKKDSANAYLQQHPDEFDAVNQSFTKELQNFNSFKQNYMQANANSAALIPVLQSIDPSQDFAGFESVVLQLEKSYPESPTVQSIKQSYLQQKQQVQEKNFLAPGKIAPDFTQNKPDGTPMKLSDLRGKVVLLDFWASWCGPCRKENPNVVAAYKKYEKDGFTVMSVSLDRSKEAWLAAIEKDNLIWPNHVSDLKQWSNEVAQQYKVSGIPFTLLLDREGKIINANLRGAELENTLRQLFGH